MKYRESKQRNTKWTDDQIERGFKEIQRNTRRSNRASAVSANDFFLCGSSPQYQWSSANRIYSVLEQFGFICPRKYFLFARRANTLLLEVKYAQEKINNSIAQEQIYESIQHIRKYGIQNDFINISENLSTQNLFWGIQISMPVSLAPKIWWCGFYDVSHKLPSSMSRITYLWPSYNLDVT